MYFYYKGLPKYPFELHHSSETHYYHYEKVGDEFCTFKFPIKDCHLDKYSDFYCYLGHKLGCGFDCETCKRHRTEFTNKEEANKNHYTNRIVSESRKKLDDGSPETWHRYSTETRYKISRRVCYDCRHFMYHPIHWCYKCGKPYAIVENLTNKEFLERFKDFAAGC